MHTLYTLGYAGWHINGVKSTAQELGAFVADIRVKPWSQNPMFQQESLKRELGGGYVHIPELGNVGYKSGVIEIVDLAQGLNRLQQGLLKRPVILLCACYHHEKCHRHYVAEAAKRMIEGVEVVNLYPKKEESVEKGERRQLGLF